MTASTLPSYPYAADYLATPVSRVPGRHMKTRRHKQPGEDIFDMAERLFAAFEAWLDRWEDALFLPACLLLVVVPVATIEGLNHLAGSPCKGSLTWLLIRVSLQCAVHNPLVGVVLVVAVGSLGAYFVPLLIEGFRAAFGARQSLSADEFLQAHGLEETVPAWA